MSKNKPVKLNLKAARQQRRKALAKQAAAPPSAPAVPAARRP